MPIPTPSWLASQALLDRRPPPASLARAALCTARFLRIPCMAAADSGRGGADSSASRRAMCCSCSPCPPEGPSRCCSAAAIWSRSWTRPSDAEGPGEGAGGLVGPRLACSFSRAASCLVLRSAACCSSWRAARVRPSCLLRARSSSSARAGGGLCGPCRGCGAGGSGSQCITLCGAALGGEWTTRAAGRAFSAIWPLRTPQCIPLCVSAALRGELWTRAWGRGLSGSRPCSPSSLCTAPGEWPSRPSRFLSWLTRAARSMPQQASSRYRAA
mmetsp:Transcript_9260/g.13837  ORF Transcript_9260/g.13837 Transcript_9260/m.13837 type:complete len:271 (-) Transcript_9260:191-1003(-)